jgi:predicted amidophosphoribosyltransferase
MERRNATGTQTRKSRYDRWTNVEDIFRITDMALIEGKHILLVDDVITTGSTVEACTNEILKANEAKVSVIALAFSPV